MDKLAKVRAEVERLHNEYRNKKGALYFRKALRTVLFIIDSLQKEPISENLAEAAIQYAKSKHTGEALQKIVAWDFEAGANWQNEQIIKRLCNHVNIDQMVEKFEDKYKPEKVLDTEYYKRGIFDTLRLLRSTEL